MSQRVDLLLTTMLWRPRNSFIDYKCGSSLLTDGILGVLVMGSKWAGLLLGGMMRSCAGLFLPDLCQSNTPHPHSSEEHFLGSGIIRIRNSETFFFSLLKFKSHVGYYFIWVDACLLKSCRKINARLEIKWNTHILSGTSAVSSVHNSSKDGHLVFMTGRGAIFQKRKILIELEEIIFM